MTTAAAPSPSALEFDRGTHRYTLNGVVVPSVTQVLRCTGYIRFDGVPEHVLETARERGRRVHQALHFLAEGDLDPSTVDELDRGYMESALLYIAHRVRRVHAAELRVWSTRYGCAGTLDLLADHDDGVLSIDDFKTGQPDDVAADLQTAAYLGFLREMAGDGTNGSPHAWIATQPVVHRRSIRLFGDGREARETLYPAARDFGRFLTALSVVNDQRALPAPLAWDDER